MFVIDPVGHRQRAHSRSCAVDPEPLDNSGSVRGRECETDYWLRVFRLIGLACKVLGLLILVLSPEPIYGPFFLGGQNDEN